MLGVAGRGLASAVAVKSPFFEQIPKMVPGEIGLARCARKVAAASSHERFEVRPFESLDGTLFGFGKRAAEIEGAALGLAAAKPITFARDVGHPDAAVVAECRCPH